MKLFSLFPKHRMEKERREEVAFQCQIADLNRQAIAIKKQADRLKAEAIRYENNGDHARAVSVANAAANQEKSYQSAINTLMTCKSMHAQLKSQKALNQLIASCSALAKSVSTDMDVSEVVSTQNEFIQTREMLERSREALEAVQEGFDSSAEAQVRNEAGEHALQQLMAESASVSAEPAAPVQTEEPATFQHAEWASDRRRMLAEML